MSISEREGKKQVRLRPANYGAKPAVQRTLNKVVGIFFASSPRKVCQFFSKRKRKTSENERASDEHQ